MFMTKMPPEEPTALQCTNRESVGDGAWACWYPQMGGYGAKCVVIDEKNGGCFEAWVWHDGCFPFPGDDPERSPTRLHHCDAAQFIRFGEFVRHVVARR